MSPDTEHKPAKCVFCDAKSSLYLGDAPICLTCDDKLRNLRPRPNHSPGNLKVCRSAKPGQALLSGCAALPDRMG